MSWIKNLWDRLFFHDADEEIIEVAPEQETEPDSRPKKSPFRFPVIKDTEKEAFLKQNPQGRTIEPAHREKPKAELLNTAPPKRRPSSPALHQNRRYEPVQHERAPKPAKPLAEAYIVSKPAKQPMPRPAAPRAPKAAHQPVTPKAPRTAKQPYEAPEQTKKPRFESQPPKKTRSFQPSRVPSPVHGYNSRIPVSAVLDTSELPVEQKSILPEQALQNAAAQKQPAAQELQVTEKAPNLAEEDVVKEQKVGEQSAIAEKQPEKASQAPLAALKTSETPAAGSKAPAKSAKPDAHREKTVPFNVLMLKSDKERLKKTSPAKPAAVADKKEASAKAEETAAKKLEVKTQLMSEVMASSKPTEPAQAEEVPYEHPKLDFLRPPEDDLIDEAWMEEQGERLIEALSHFQIQASILSIVQGPAVTQFEVTVAQGVKVSKIRNLADDLKLALAARDIRIQAPIPGRSSIGVEIPNRKSRPVRLSEVIGSPVFEESESPLEAALGLDLRGKPVTLDLRKMPHGLIAGATGSGKSVCINSLLVSLLYKSSPRDLKLLLIDPKMVELAPYNHIPHLISPVITDVKAATASLKWAVEEMERRYKLFAHVGVRDLNRYNKLVKEKGDHAQHLPYILIVIDELADLMMMSPSDVEDAICRIAQKARACGIHLVIATQRPSVDVITGLIKSNIPTRIAFSVSSQVDSRTILDSQGAERLLGRGDMLYLGNGMSAPVRLQGTFVTDDEIEDVIAHVRKQGEPEYFFKEDELIKHQDSPDVQDDLFEEACRFIISQGTASTSLLQRKFHIGYNRAARLMDLIEQHGFISEQNGSKARAVLITEDDMSDVFQQ
jgi:S-DNA-T family DNA segregation ATPase FtsK/SpoIIIE